MPAGQAYVQGEVPARSRTAFLGTAWGKAMWATRRETRSSLYSSGTVTVQTFSQSWQPVHLAKSTKAGLRTTVALKPPLLSRRTSLTSLKTRRSMLAWLADCAILGVEMQLAQSRVGKTLLSRIILPPMLGSFSTSSTLKPMSPRLTAASMPAMPAPMTMTS